MHQQLKIAGKFDLHLIKDFFDANTCREIVKDMSSSPAGASLTYGKGEGAVDDRIRRAVEVSPSAAAVEYVNRRLEEARSELADHFRVALSGYEPPQFLCYRVGDFFVAHQDGNTGMVNLESDRTRRISISIFLNSQSEEHQSGAYCGGSLLFSDWQTGSRQEVLGEAGTLLAFRSETTHEVTPVTQGKRYAIVSWFGQYGDNKGAQLLQS